MTYGKFRQVINFYRRHLGELGVTAHENGLPLQHVAWMLDKMLLVASDDYAGVGHMKAIDKVNRWLGFVQGVLYMERVFTILQMREHNREAP